MSDSAVRKKISLRLKGDGEHKSNKESKPPPKVTHHEPPNGTWHDNFVYLIKHRHNYIYHNELTWTKACHTICNYIDVQPLILNLRTNVICTLALKSISCLTVDLQSSFKDPRSVHVCSCCAPSGIIVIKAVSHNTWSVICQILYCMRSQN